MEPWNDGGGMTCAAHEWRGRGWLCIDRVSDFEFGLFDWSEHMDSGADLGRFETLEDAFLAARAAQTKSPSRRVVVLGEVLAEHRQ